MAPFVPAQVIRTAVRCSSGHCPEWLCQVVCPVGVRRLGYREDNVAGSRDGAETYRKHVLVQKHPALTGIRVITVLYEFHRKQNQ